MTATPSTDAPVARPSGARRPSPWRQLLVASAVAGTVVFLAVAVCLGDLEAAAYGVVSAIGAGLLRLRRAWIGAALLCLLYLNVLVWMALGVASNVRSGDGFVAVAIPALLTAVALAAVAAAVGDLVTRRRDADSWGPRAVAVGAAGVFVILAVAGAVTANGARPAGGDLLVVSNNVLFDPTELTAEARQVTVRMTNRDLFWHTFTIDELGVDLWVAVSAERAVTFDAAPGAYTYYCRIPGHEARMRGTLTVTD
jgi:plastocyanin